MNKIKWGILGCGHIAHKFAKSLASVDDGTLVACASRTPGRAASFAAEESVPTSYECYETMLSEAGLDAVYVATTHNFHVENVLLALAHGKAVLCEKPLGVNVEESRRMVEAAREKGLFLMEGMWTRFLPAIRQMKVWLDAGKIGQVKMLRASFSIEKPFDPQHRLYNPALAGGALLDVGIYPVSIASFVMGGQPERISALANFAGTGVDETTLMNFGYVDGAMAQLNCGIRSPSENRVEIVGETGRVVIPEFFPGAKRVEIHSLGGDQEKLNLPYADEEGFRFEILEVHRALQAGKTESAVMPLDETVALAETMDKVLEYIR
ncbi:Gfo/Idh/MocA family oxidoreductase [Kiritimatiellaeota bacterium B1221]|nr:Gfo/Idh/MocA family oxidoreductase [Kiritimatiellaeota bacterium B1221]